MENDRRAQKVVYEQLYGRMLSVCKRYADDEDAAKDMVSVGFIKVFKHISDFGFKGSFEGWVRRIMVNVALDDLKRNRLKSTLFVSWEQVGYDNESYIGNAAIDRLNIKDLYAIIEKLSPVSRAVFNMYVIDGFSHKEIAEKMNISEGTSKWHVSNARQFLQYEIAKQDEVNIKKTI